MKKALKLLIVYILLLVIGILAGSIVYSLYLNTLNYSTGKDASLFSKDVFTRAFFFVSACVAFFICPVIAFRNVRKNGGILSLISFLIVSVFTWFLFVPFILKSGNQGNYFDRYVSASEISSGYFRKSGDKVYYHFPENDATKNKNNVIIIDTVHDGKVEIVPENAQVNALLKDAAKPYADVLTKEVFENKRNFRLVDFHLILENACSAMAKEGSFWIGFLSLALLLCSTYGLSNLYRWRLMNSCSIFFVTLCALVVNTLYFSPKFEQFKIKHFYSSGLYLKLSNVFDEPPLVLLNCLFSIIFILTGIILYFVNKKRVEE